MPFINLVPPIIEKYQLHSAFLPKDLQNGASTGKWVGIAKNQQLTIIFFKADGTAGDDPVLHLEQAEDISGTGAKDLDFQHYYLKQGTLLTTPGTANFSFFKSGKSLNNDLPFDAVSAEQELLAAIVIDFEQLDEGFNHVRVICDDVGSNEQFGCALYLVSTLPEGQFIGIKDGYWNGQDFVDNRVNAKTFLSYGDVLTETASKGYSGVTVARI